MPIVTIATQKGGTGKTTTVHALGAGLCRKGFRVLYIDLDPQGNLTYTLGADRQGATAFEVLTAQASATEALQYHTGKNTDEGWGVIPSGPSLSATDQALNLSGKEYRLKQALGSLRDSFDYMIIDTPPSLGILTVNALTASDSVIIPAQADIYSLQGIGQLYNTITVIRQFTNPQLTINGILLTRHNSRSILSRDLAELIEETARQISTRVFKTTIRETIIIKEAQASRQDLFTYAPKSKAAADYLGFIEEYLNEQGACP